MAGCGQHAPPAEDPTAAPNTPGNVPGQFPSGAIQPPRPTGLGGPVVAPAIERGTGLFMRDTPVGPVTPPAIPPGEAVTLDFVNVDVRDVVRSVLGEVLKVTYVIDPSVQGTLTLQIKTPMPRPAAFTQLENALRLSGVALLNKNGVIHVIPAANVAREAQLNGPDANGFIARTITPQYVGAADLQRVLEPMLPAGSTVRSDPSRNLLFVTGSAQAVATILDNIAIFDVDYLAGMSFALLPLRNGQAKDIAKEITTLIGGDRSAVAGMVRVTPIGRLNALLVTAMKPAYLDRVTAWVAKLDQGGISAETPRLFLYRVQNGRATDLASVLRRALGVETSPPANQAGRPQTGDLDQTDVTTDGRPPATAQPLANPLLGGLGVNRLPQTPAAPAAPANGPDDTNLTLQGGNAATGIRVTADDANNAVLIMATGPEYRWIEAALTKLDIPPLQVMIETVVAEVTLTDQLSYGLQYYIKAGQLQALLAQPNATAQNPTAQASSTFSGFGFTQGFNLSFTGSSGSSVILQLLQQISKVSVLSSPNLMVLNNHSAKIQVGDQVPITTQSAVSVLTPSAPVVNSISYRDTGIIMQIRPRVNASGQVTLEIAEEVSQVAPTTSSTLNTPTISQRRMSSTVTIGDGQTVALGGLISDSRTNSTNGIPGFQDLKWLGFLFGTKGDNSARTELIVLITPHVVYDQVSVQAVTDELRRKLPLTVPLLKRHGR